jgi:4-hydroxy-2-oxoheptanedioate aldolase
LDAIYVGPSDLSLALGCEPRLDPTERVVVEAIEYISTQALAKKIVAGIHTDSPVYAQRMIQQGFRFVTIGTDVRLLVAKASEVLEAMGRRPLPGKPAAAPTGPY